MSSQLRRNPLNGRWVTVASDRSARPDAFAPRDDHVEAGPVRPCPFCPGNEEETPPALESYARDGSWVVRVVPNLYPAFDGRGPLEVSEITPVFLEAPGTGLHEVLVLSPDHHAPWSALDDRQAGLVMAAVRDRLEDHARRPEVRYTQIIVNHGREAGASVAHPHGQLVGIPFVPGDLVEEKAGFTEFSARHGECLLCRVGREELAVGVRTVFEDDDVLVVCPFWAGSPYEMLVLPRGHESHLERDSPGQLAAVGRALREVLVRLNGVVGDLAYNIVVHTAPHGDDGHYHWHVHVLPRLTSVAGFEQGTGVRINIVAPEIAAEHLRSVERADTADGPASPSGDSSGDQ
jgi:UDPglucose--hexose-1-phosphate uridylyltransferase